MKYLPIILLSLLFINCKNKVKEDSGNEIKAGKFLWTAEWTNGVQENPKDMTKTVYVLLSATNATNSICDDKNLISNSVYKELWKNDNTVENPVWSLRKDDSSILNYEDVSQEFCENDEAIFAIVDLNKFDYPMLDRYPLFKTKKE